MRLFIGTAIPISVAEELRGLADEFLSLTHWRPAPLDQLHITALFIGERPEELLPAILNTVTRIAAATPMFGVRNGRILTMPKEEPTMLWVRFRPEPQLTALHLALADATGTPPSIYRPYWPHITMARANGIPAPVDGHEVLPSFTIDHLTLFRSSPSPQGAVHEPLASWPLTGKDPAAPAEAV